MLHVSVCVSACPCQQVRNWLVYNKPLGHRPKSLTMYNESTLYTARLTAGLSSSYTFLLRPCRNLTSGSCSCSIYSGQIFLAENKHTSEGGKHWPAASRTAYLWGWNSREHMYIAFFTRGNAIYHASQVGQFQLHIHVDCLQQQVQPAAVCAQNVCNILCVLCVHVCWPAVAAVSSSMSTDGWAHCALCPISFFIWRALKSPGQRHTHTQAAQCASGNIGKLGGKGNIVPASNLWSIMDQKESKYIIKQYC